ncbi:MAG: hypothetical protein AB8F95_10515 [Bacteroidia bacterium]
MENAPYQYSFRIWGTALLIGNALLIPFISVLVIVSAFVSFVASLFPLFFFYGIVSGLSKIDVSMRIKLGLVTLYCFLTGYAPILLIYLVDGDLLPVEMLLLPLPFCLGAMVGIMLWSNKPLRYSPSIDIDPDALIDQIGHMIHDPIIND